LQGLSPETLLEHLSCEKRLEGLSPEVRLQGIPLEALEAPVYRLKEDKPNRKTQ
jgi:hypothetical protein